MIFFGVNSLWRAINEYSDHYHLDRPHQGLGNDLITEASTNNRDGEVIVTARLGGLLRSYQRAA